MRSLVLLLFAGTGCEALVGDKNGGHAAYTPIAELDAAEVERNRIFCIEELNRYRAKKLLPPLTRAADIEAFADEGAAVDAYAAQAHTHFSTNPFPGPVRASAENEIRNWSLKEYVDLQAIIIRGFAQMWAEEGTPMDGHFKNMIGDYQEAGCGFYLDVPTQAVTVVQDFRQTPL